MCLFYLHAPVTKLQQNIKSAPFLYENNISNEYLFNPRKPTPIHKTTQHKTIFIDATNADFLKRKHLNVIPMHWKVILKMVSITLFCHNFYEPAKNFVFSLRLYIVFLKPARYFNHRYVRITCTLVHWATFLFKCHQRTKRTTWPQK